MKFMIVEIQKNASKKEIKEAFKKIKTSKKSPKGFPNLDKFFGSIKEQDFVAIQKSIRDEWE